MSFEPGAIDVRTVAARLRACYVVDRHDWRWGGCAYGALARLSAHGRDFTSSDSATRAWLLVGVGPELRWSPLPRFGLGVSAQLLASPQNQSFAVHGLSGAAYRSDRFVGWLGADLSVQLW